MAYREDPDLKFLGDMSSEDLNDLVDALTKDNDGQVRLTEELTGRDVYRKHYPNHSRYWQEIAAEVQCFGANSLVTLFRGGKGVLYREVLEDVCDKVKLKHSSHQSVSELESQLLIKLLGDATAKMSDADREAFAKAAGLNAIKSMTPEGLAAAAQAAFLAGGFQSYQLALFTVNYISRLLLGRGLTLAANATLARTLGVLTGPVGWAITGAWTAFDIASPAFRVTLPAVVHMALLRQKHQAKASGRWLEFEQAMKP